ncbi:MAG: HNH endonuclease [Christensenellaceae bacterium]
MIGAFATTLQETAKEAIGSELKNIPRFFEDMQETQEKADTPVAKIENTESKGIIYLITRNEGLEEAVHPITGVPFKRRMVELTNGEVIEGVFPEFPSAFNVQIPEELYSETDYKQFKCCNEQLYDATQRDTELKSKFTKEQIEQIKDGISDGTAPDGYVWHHDALPGKIQLIEFEIHANTGHTGGRTVWGGGNEHR